ncbi:AAA family ATPase [uncultured Citricoccus sp.]|uniref:AAA family ATPase n=1 Tax=uncultured Citricoccus sp. TaxID=614031 RepID=UPI002625290D|nr:AAA family ATPase [uncultured Citricoccus sp.]
MLRRLDWIRDENYFDGFSWDASLPDFQRVNLIYGNNGSGKSSLAQLLDALRTDPSCHQKVSVAIEDGAHARTTNGTSDPVFNRVLVFSDEYVERSHRFRDGSADMEAVLTLGERTEEDEERLDQLAKEQQKLLTERAERTAEERNHQRDLKGAYERTAQAVVDDLSPAGGIYASRGKYSVAKAKSRLHELSDRLAPLLLEQVTAKKQLISGGNREPLPTEGFSLAVDGTLVETAKRLLSTTPVTIVLDTLQAHPEASSWVQQGLALHQHSDTCAFCGGPLPEARKLEIEKHFSREVDQLQRELREQVQILADLNSKADGILQRVPARGLLFDDLRERFDPEAQLLRDDVKVLKKWIADLRAKFTSKLANVLTSVAYDLPEPPPVRGAGLERICEEHNHRVNAHAQLVSEAALDLEIHHLHTENEQIRELVQRCSAVTDRLTEITDRLDEIGIDIAALENAEGDPTPSAQVLTREVARLLGRTELKFEPSGKRYRVMRNGMPATGLSMGERTAVTLVHFLETVARFDPKGDRPIVVIDDPVSSLDSNVFMGISTYIWSAAVSTKKNDISQLFVLTHSFDLFRQWDIQLENLHRAKGMQAAFPAERYELQGRHLSFAGETRRRPVLKQWPESTRARKKLRSSYHHAFLMMALAHKDLRTTDSLENRLDAQLLFPNVIRRVLESFLAFKRPEMTGDFTGSMRETTAMLEAAGYEGDADALRQQLTRFTHAHSHSETPDTNDVVNGDEVATVLSTVFVFLKHLDEAHFNGLCEVVGIDPDDLAAAPVEDI